MKKILRRKYNNNRPSFNRYLVGILIPVAVLVLIVANLMTIPSQAANWRRRPKPTPTATPSPIPSPTPTLTPTPSTLSPSPTPTPASQPTNTPTANPTSTPAITNTPTPTPTSTPTNSPTPTPTPTQTPTPTATSTPTPTPTNTPSSTPTLSPTPSILSPSPTPTPTPTLSPNLILNPSLDDAGGDGNPAYWYRGNWGTNSATFTYPVVGQSGNAAQIDLTNYTDGDAKWYFADVTVTPGQNYTFSDFYQSTTDTHVIARYTLTGNTFQYLYFHMTPTAGTWQFFSHAFTVPANVVSMTIFHLINTPGSLTIDQASLIATPNQNQTFLHGLISLDFDDAWRSVYDNAIPILNTLGLRSTQYILTGTDYLGQYPYMTMEQVLAMQAAGHEIGAHTRNHPDLTTLTENQIIDEVTGSKSDLENNGVATISSFSYPYGAWNNSIIQTVKDSGYLGARTALPEDGGFNYKNGDPYLLKTKSVEIDTPLDSVKQWIDQAISSQTWLIMVFHQVEDNGGQYSTTPSRLQEIGNYLISTGASVITASQGIFQMTH